MGACVLCGKSAGPFYSLHKKCYQRFQSSTDPIVNLLATKLGSASVPQLAQEITDHIDSFEFAAEARQRALVRGLEAFSSQEIERKDHIPESCSAWIELLEHLGLDESLFINPSFIAQQKALPTLRSLQAGELPVSNCVSNQFPGDILLNEELLWRFYPVHYEQLQPRSPKRQWSVIAQVLSSALPNRRRQSILQKKEIDQGVLWLTNQRMLFEGPQENTTMDLSSIDAITPEFDGVTLQFRELTSMPQTFRCQQGQLLYRFLRHAQTISN